jgi:2-polyprenyl-6-methoxyphenol hydroxylase-like FAD-dependent oxidoreductase
MALRSHRGTDEQVSVLIVGGSLVGLSTALFLRLHGVDCLSVERHSGTAIHPRAGHFQLRTVEILRWAGLEDEVKRRSEEKYLLNGGINNVESLAGREIASYFPNLNAGVEEFSPTLRLFIDQDVLEPILRTRAQELGAGLRNRVECTALEQDDTGVTATLRDLDDGGETTVRSDYVVAADGNRSPTRERLGIAMRGHGVLSNSVTIYFRSDVGLAPLLKGRDQGVNYVTNPVLRGFFRLDRTGNRGFLVVNLIGDTARPEIVAAYPSAPWANAAQSIDEQRALELVRAAIGVPEIPVVIEDVAKWQAVADSAERYREGRVFLAGDAAHTMPPNGGFGGNTGVQDAHNLAWKLAFALRGVADPRLLDTYDDERRAIGELTVEQAYTRYVTRVAPYLGTEGMQALVDDFSIEIGCRCNSAAVVLEPGDDEALHEHPRESKGRPGSRAPHVLVPRDGARVSTLDLFGNGFVLLAGADGAAWHEAALSAAGQFGVPLDGYVIADAASGFADAYGISQAGAVLVRPDGVVAWRAVGAESEPQRIVRRALASVLCKED